MHQYSRIATLCATLGLLIFAAEPIHAATVDLTWATTVQSFDGTAIPGTIGEQITTTFEVNNGSASTLSQSWSASDFISYRIQGASGWWIESTFISTSDSSGLFSTNSLGGVISAGDWFGGWPTASITTSWGGVMPGGWWNNGGNQVACNGSAIDCVWANNVQDNLIGSSWNASLETSIPEPATVTLIGLGFAGMAYRRRRSV